MNDMRAALSIRDMRAALSIMGMIAVIALVIMFYNVTAHAPAPSQEPVIDEAQCAAPSVTICYWKNNKMRCKTGAVGALGSFSGFEYLGK